MRHAAAPGDLVRAAKLHAEADGRLRASARYVFIYNSGGFIGETTPELSKFDEVLFICNGETLVQPMRLPPHSSSFKGIRTSRVSQGPVSRQPSSPWATPWLKHPLAPIVRDFFI